MIARAFMVWWRFRAAVPYFHPRGCRARHDTSSENRLIALRVGNTFLQSMWSLRDGGFESDLIAQLFEFAHELPLHAFAVQSLKIVGS